MQTDRAYSSSETKLNYSFANGLRRTKLQKQSAPYLFILPYFIFYGVFSLFPIIFSLYISFTSWNGIGKMDFVGLDNYKFLFDPNSYFFKSVGNTIFFVVISLPVQIAIGLLLATLLYSQYTKWKGFFRVINFLPFIVTPVAIGVIFGLLFDWQTGVVNKVLLELGWIGEAIDWRGDARYVRWVIILMIFWKGFGYVMLFYLAGLANIPKELYEAADVDGATGLRKFFQITVPLLRPVTVFIILTGIIGGFQLMEEPMLLIQGTGMGIGNVGGPDRVALTAMWNIYDTAFGNTSRLGLGAAMGYGLCIIVIFFTLIGNKFLNKGDEA